MVHVVVGALYVRFHSVVCTACANRYFFYGRIEILKRSESEITVVMIELGLVDAF